MSVAFEGKEHSTAVMAHRSRKDQVTELLSHVGPDVPVAWDEVENVWETRKRTMQLHDGRPFHVMLQDDAIVCKDFHDRLDSILKERGDQHAYSLFFRIKPGTAWPRPQMAQAAVDHRNDGGFLFPRLQFGVGIVLPTRIIEPMIEFVDGMIGNETRQDDLQMNEYLVSIDMECFYPLPSLVDHRKDGWSLVGNGPNTKRISKWFVGV